jgi:hypothetical protein
MFETLLIYVEGLLRAQLSDSSGLNMPAAIGRRVERCLLLRARLERLSREPIIDFVREDSENPQLRLLTEARNKWAHSGPIAETDRRELDRALEYLLAEVTAVSIGLICTADRGSRSAIELAGLAGIFGGRLIDLENNNSDVSNLADLTLVAIPPIGDIVRLSPFMVYEMGMAGEHRVRLLTRLRGGKPEYLDPFEAIGSLSADLQQ